MHFRNKKIKKKKKRETHGVRFALPFLTRTRSGMKRRETCGGGGDVSLHGQQVSPSRYLHIDGDRKRSLFALSLWLAGFQTRIEGICSLTCPARRCRLEGTALQLWGLR